jgi:hypothetical protein
MNINLSRNRIKNFVIRPVFLCFSLFYGITSISGQSLNFDHYSVENGISQSEIKCIYQDSEGYIWIGTQNGLNRFDGYTFEKYFYDPSNNYSISNNWIFGITEDPDGGIWLGTKGGLNKFDKKMIFFTGLITGTQIPLSKTILFTVLSLTKHLYISILPPFLQY